MRMPTNVFLNLQEEKKARITSALVNEFSRFPFEEVQVKRIVESARIARGSFYQYFTNIKDALIYVLRHLRSQIITENISGINQNEGNDILEIIRNYFLKTLKETFTHRDLHTESRILDQIRKSPIAIEIFINEFGRLDRFEKQLSKQDCLSKIDTEILFEIVFPTLKLTIEKLLRNKITISQANEEMNQKLDIISAGYTNFRK